MKKNEFEWEKKERKKENLQRENEIKEIKIERKKKKEENVYSKYMINNLPINTR